MGRIRTVKPEFWRHPVMARLPEGQQLLALALLNYSDDHGYFLADPALVRGEVMPFRDSLAKLRADLEALAAAGWAEFRDHPEMGPVGRIANWTDHQKVDHPRASKVREYFDACAPRESVAKAREDFAKPRELFALEQGTGNRDGNREQGAPEVVAVLPAAGFRVDPPKAKPEDLQRLWNEEAHSDLPRWEELTEERADSAKARLKKHPDLSYWRTVLQRIGASAFCRGENDRGWRADPEFFLRASTGTKVLEGKYDGRKGTGPPKRVDFSMGMVRSQDVDKRQLEAVGVVNEF